MKKIVSIVLICLMLSAMAMPTFATDEVDTSRIIVDGVDITINIEDEIQRAKSGITDIETNSDFFSVKLIADEDDMDASVKTYTTTREITLASNGTAACMADAAEPKIYATTFVSVLANEKEDSASKKGNGVTAYGTIYWRDNVGPANNLLGVSGGWAAETDPTTGNTPTVYDRSVTVQCYFDASNREYKYFCPNSDSFSYPQSEFKNWTAFRFALDTKAKITEKLGITLHVETGFFT